MAEPGTRHDLTVDKDEHEQRTTPKLVAVGDRNGRALPVTAGEHTKRHHQAEERLSHAAVNSREERRNLGHASAAQDPLDDHGEQRDHAKSLDPAAGVESEEPEHQSDRRQPHRCAIEPVRVLDLNPKGGVPEIVKEHVDAEGAGPVRDRQPDPISRHRAPNEEQGQGERRGAECHPMRASPISRRRGRNRVGRTWECHGREFTDFRLRNRSMITRNSVVLESAHARAEHENRRPTDDRRLSP